MEKRGQFTFSWLFALIIGAVILFLAIYGATKFGGMQRYETDTEIAKKISILTDPLQAGFAEGRYGTISFRQETKINNICFSYGFGKNDISVSTRSGIGEEWIQSGGATSIHNKYIFSSFEQGETFYLFSKPFYFPYKVSDLIFLTSKEFCFIGAPERIEDEVLGLGIENIKVVDCSDEAEKVCFGSGNCDINVYGTCMSNCKSDYDEGYVEKHGERFNYAGSLMYAAIFSDKRIYDCNVKRLMYRTVKISEVFRKKAELMNGRGCNTNLYGDLVLLGDLTINATSQDLISINQLGKQAEEKNDLEVCGIW